VAFSVAFAVVLVDLLEDRVAITAPSPSANATTTPATAMTAPRRDRSGWGGAGGCGGDGHADVLPGSGAGVDVMSSTGVDTMNPPIDARDWVSRISTVASIRL
jgi:hypothetical protein